jgi:acetylornithine/LysW-gamma-L-lysine aminotransferase
MIDEGSPMDTMQVENRYTSGCYSKRGVTIVRGEGARIWDDAGREYIDCVGGHGVAIVGHCNPAVVQAICDQARTLITCPEIFYSDVRARLLEKLVSIAPAGLERAMLVNSGTEAVEGALKHRTPGHCRNPAWLSRADVWCVIHDLGAAVSRAL